MSSCELVDLCSVLLMGSVCVGIGIALSYTLQWTKQKTQINDYFDVYIKRKRAPFQTPSRFKLHSFIFTFRECWQIFKWALCTHYSTLFLLFFFVFYSSVVFTCCLLFQLSCYPKEELLLCFFDAVAKQRNYRTSKSLLHTFQPFVGFSIL